MHLRCPSCKEQSVKVIHFKKQNAYGGRSRDKGTLVCEKCEWRDVIR